MVLGMNCFGAPEAARKVSPASRGLRGEGAEAVERKAAVVKEEAPSGRVVGEAKQMGGGDRVTAAGKEEEKKKRSGAPIVMHHFPFHSRPGLL
ncbi:hypothetical protein ZWY2020_053014 [Hordeum vulgare]|nr:hypothetical protein ZWY2020_053014 [Hordeum vulgare]